MIVSRQSFCFGKRTQPAEAVAREGRWACLKTARIKSPVIPYKILAVNFQVRSKAVGVG